MNDNKVSVRVWGDFACFTRPEMKVERVSYPVMTPSAARGILEAIFWKPEMYYLIDSIAVIKRGEWAAFKRNELKEKISLANAAKWMKGTAEIKPLLAGGGAPDATPRNTLALRNVEYVVTAEIRLTKIGENAQQTIRKFTEELSRRARLGKCFHRPGLGLKEFDAHFELIEDASGISGEWNEDLGLMLYDVFNPAERTHGFKFLDSAPEKPARGKKMPTYEGFFSRPKPIFFNARIVNSRLECHPERVELIAQDGGEN